MREPFLRCAGVLDGRDHIPRPGAMARSGEWVTGGTRPSEASGGRNVREHRGFSGWKAGCATAALAVLLAGCASPSSGPGGQAPSPAPDEQAPVVGVVQREVEFVLR